MPSVRKVRYCYQSGYNGTTGDHAYFTECPICFALLEEDREDEHKKWHALMSPGVFDPPPPVAPEGVKHNVHKLNEQPKSDYIFAAKREGDLGTWSHCGAMYKHPPHAHDIHMTGESAYDIICNGTD